MRTIDDLEVTGRRVLVRLDLNVPRDGDRITDDEPQRRIPVMLNKHINPT